MTAAGVTSGNFTGELTDLGGYPSANVSFQYGIGIPSTNTTVQVVAATGNYTTSFPVNLTPGATYTYRAVGQNIDGIAYGANVTFTLTMPSVTTFTNTVAPSTVTLRGNIPNMGVASNAYARISYGTTPALGSTTALQTVSGTGIFFASVPPPTTSTTLYYRADVIVGGITVSGAVATASIPAATGGSFLNTVLLVILAAAIIAGVTVSFLTMGVIPGLIATAIGIIGFAIISAILAII